VPLCLTPFRLVEVAETIAIDSVYKRAYVWVTGVSVAITFTVNPVAYANGSAVGEPEHYAKNDDGDDDSNHWDDVGRLCELASTLWVHGCRVAGLHCTRTITTIAAIGLRLYRAYLYSSFNVELWLHIFTLNVRVNLWGCHSPRMNRE